MARLGRKWAWSIIVSAILAFCTPAVLRASGLHEVIILHTNDLHGHVLAQSAGNDGTWGLAHLASQVSELRRQNPGRVIWMDAGDTWHGTNLANAFQGESVVDILNIAGLDLMVLGNHDFNYGITVVRERASQAKFPILAGNVLTGDAEPLVASTARMKVGDLTLGIIGLTSPNTPILTHPRNVDGLVFLDPIAVARDLVAQLADADLIVAVTHIGLDFDRILAEAVPEIDVIVGGHSHSLLPEPIVVNGTPIVQAHEWGKYLGVLRLLVDDQGIVAHEGHLIPITHDLPLDDTVVALTDAWSRKLDDVITTVVGETRVDLDGSIARVRTMETNLGNLVADVARQTAAADIGLVNSGTIRHSMATGPITLGAVLEALPFDNSVVGVFLTGGELLRVLENSVLYYPHASGRFLQVSGLSYTFDPDAPPGNRVTDVRIDHAGQLGGSPLQIDAIYKVAVTDYMALGGDDYTMLIDAPRFYGSATEGGAVLAELMRDHLAVASPVAPQVSGRIRLVTRDAGLQAGFVDARALIPDLLLDIRYYGADNFVGTPIDGYVAPLCILSEEAADALSAVQRSLARFGLGIKVFDCYRPTTAVAHFVSWAQDLEDTVRKHDYYPEVNKADLFDLGYIAERSGHSRGSTVDLTIVDLATGGELDMGTGFDMFSTLSWPDELSMTPEQRANRLLLRLIMLEHGFRPYEMEWWHFTLADEPYRNTYFDFEVR